MHIDKVKLWLFIIFLFAINLFNMESRILVLAFLLVMLTQRRHLLPITKTSAVLLAFSVFLYGFAIIYNSSMMTYYIIPFLLGPFLGYSIGYIIANNQEMDIHKSVKWVIYAIVFGRFFHGALNFIVSNGYRGFLRNGYDFWTKSIIAATGQGALMTMSISLLFYALFCVNKRQLLEKIFLIFVVILSALNSLLSATRTSLLVMLIVFFACIIYTLGISDLKRSLKQKIIIGLLFVAVVGIIGFNMNALGLKTMWETSPLVARMNTLSSYESGDENRIIMYQEAIYVGLHNFIGDGNMNKTAHNLWLDTFRQVGWIPFILLVIFTIDIIRHSIFVIKNEHTLDENKYLILSVLLASLINFSVEPIMKGMPYYFVAFCTIGGAIERYKVRLNDIPIEESRC